MNFLFIGILFLFARIPPPVVGVQVVYNDPETLPDNFLELGFHDTGYSQQSYLQDLNDFSDSNQLDPMGLGPLSSYPETPLFDERVNDGRGASWNGFQEERPKFSFHEENPMHEYRFRERERARGVVPIRSHKSSMLSTQHPNPNERPPSRANSMQFEEAQRGRYGSMQGRGRVDPGFISTMEKNPLAYRHRESSEDLAGPPRFKALRHSQMRLAMQAEAGHNQGMDTRQEYMSAEELTKSLKKKGYSESFIKAFGERSEDVDEDDETRIIGEGKNIASSFNTQFTEGPYTKKDLDILDTNHNIATGKAPDPLEKLRDASSHVGGGPGETIAMLRNPGGAEALRFRELRKEMVQTNFTETLENLFPHAERPLDAPIPHFEATLIHSKFPYPVNSTESSQSGVVSDQKLRPLPIMGPNHEYQDNFVPDIPDIHFHSRPV